MYRPKELRAFLQELGAFPKKGLSQNFLIDGNIIRKTVAVSEVKPHDLVLEIGPGPGSLTQSLLEAGAYVIAVEKDCLFAKALERLQTPAKQLHVFCEDILTFSFEAGLARLKQTHPDLKGKMKVIANLPYHLTTPILIRLVPRQDLFSSLTIMVQEEVAVRLTARPGTAAYSSLTVFLRFYSDPYYAFSVSRSCFYPIPKVDSAVVVLPLHLPPLPEEEAVNFFKLTRTAFEQRRKMLRASLKSLFAPQTIEEALTMIGQDPLARPERLSLEDFLRLYVLLKPTS